MTASSRARSLGSRALPSPLQVVMLIGVAGASVVVCGAGGCDDRTAAPPPAPKRVLPDLGWRRGVCGPQGWCWGYPRPQGVRLNRLWGSGPRDLWAVGDAGAIVRFDGTAWTRVDSGSTAALVAISGSGAGDAWAAGRERTLLHLRGTSWSRWAPPTAGDDHQSPPEQAAGDFRDVLALPNGEAWVVGGSERGGPADDDAGGACIVGHFDAGAWRFDQDLECNPLVEVWGRSADDVWARGGGDVLHWNGRTLTKNPLERPARIVGRHGAADGWRLQIDWASGTVGTLLHAAHVPRPEQAPPARDFWAFGASDVWAIGGEGELAHFDGRTWENGDVPLRVQDVAARAPDDLWAVASPATLLHFDGRAWNASPIPGAGAAVAVAVATPAGTATNDVWVLAGNNVLRFDGARWSKPPGAAQLGHRTPTALLALGPEDVWIGAERLALHWNGHTLEPHETDFAVSVLWGEGGEVWAGSPPHRWTGGAFVVPLEIAGAEKTPGPTPWAGTARAGVVWLAQGGRIWRLAAGELRTAVKLPVSLRAIWQSPSGDVWAVGSRIVHGTADAAGAMSWTIEDSVGLTDMTRVGGTHDLVWVRGAEGVLVRGL